MDNHPPCPIYTFWMNIVPEAKYPLYLFLCLFLFFSPSFFIVGYCWQVSLFIASFSSYSQLTFPLGRFGLQARSDSERSPPPTTEERWVFSSSTTSRTKSLSTVRHPPFPSTSPTSNSTLSLRHPNVAQQHRAARLRGGQQDPDWQQVRLGRQEDGVDSAGSGAGG